MAPSGQVKRSTAQLSSSFASCAFGVIRSRRFAVIEHRERQRTEGRGRGFSCGSGFQPRSCVLSDFYDFNDLNGFNDCNGFPFTAYRNIKSKTQMNANAETTPKIEDSTMTLSFRGRKFSETLHLHALYHVIAWWASAST